MVFLPPNVWCGWWTAQSVLGFSPHWEEKRKRLITTSLFSAPNIPPLTRITPSVSLQEHGFGSASRDTARVPNSSSERCARALASTCNGGVKDNMNIRWELWMCRGLPPSPCATLTLLYTITRRGRERGQTAGAARGNSVRSSQIHQDPARTLQKTGQPSAWR